MLSKWLTTNAPTNIKKVDCLYLIVGHSFLPPDRVFGRLEKKIRSMSTIVVPNENMEIYRTQGTVIRVSSERQCPLYDWKTAVKSVMKPPASYHFQFSPLRGSNWLKKVVLYSSKEVNYCTESGIAKSLLKRGMSLNSIRLSMIDIGMAVKDYL